MTLVVKICGLSTRATLDAALEGGADMVGLVFFPASPRHVELDSARELARAAAPQAEVVALTVDADDAQLGAIIAAVSPQLLQLHGHETPQRVAAIKQRFGLPVMKALPIATAADLAVLPDYAAVADRLLFDARPPKDATRPGGSPYVEATGKSHVAARSCHSPVWTNAAAGRFAVAGTSIVRPAPVASARRRTRRRRRPG